MNSTNGNKMVFRPGRMLELRDFSSYNTEAVRRKYSSLVHRCDTYLLEHPGASLWIRETDHRNSPIRLEGNVPSEDYDKLVLSECAICGSNVDLRAGDDDFGCVGVCGCCKAMMVPDNLAAEFVLRPVSQLFNLLKFLKHSDAEDKNASDEHGGSSIMLRDGKDYNINGGKIEVDASPNDAANANVEEVSNIGVRVLTMDNIVCYVKLADLRINVDGKLYISRNGDHAELVRFAGFDLHVQDANGNTLYQGDILRIDKYDEGDVSAEDDANSLDSASYGVIMYNGWNPMSPCFGKTLLVSAPMPWPLDFGWNITDKDYIMAFMERRFFLHQSSDVDSFVNSVMAKSYGLESIMEYLKVEVIGNIFENSDYEFADGVKARDFIGDRDCNEKFVACTPDMTDVIEFIRGDLDCDESFDACTPEANPSSGDGDSTPGFSFSKLRDRLFGKK